MRSSSVPSMSGKKNPRISKANPKFHKASHPENLPPTRAMDKKYSSLSFDSTAGFGSITNSVRRAFRNSRALFTRTYKSKLKNQISKISMNFNMPQGATLTEDEAFFNQVAVNSWRANHSAVFKADNDQDNKPQHFLLREFDFCISQNRGGSADQPEKRIKPEGQDCMGAAWHKNYEVFVLCDGHDSEGHLVAQGICATLPHYILRRVFERKPEKINRPLEDTIFIDAFKEAESTVCWMRGDEVELLQGDIVKVLKGEHEGQIGYVANFLNRPGSDDGNESDSPEESETEDEDEEESENESGNRKADQKNEKISPAPPPVKKVPSARGENDPEEQFVEELKMTIVIENHLMKQTRFQKTETEVAVPRFNGGCTCLCFVRNTKSNICRVAVMGDSRMMLLGNIGAQFKDEDFLDPVLMSTYLDLDESELEGFRNTSQLSAANLRLSLSEVRKISDDSQTAKKQKATDAESQSRSKNRASLTNIHKGKTLQEEIDEVVGYFTPQHNVHNLNERERLKQYSHDTNGQLVVNLELGYLVNPTTKMQIQPTRGFGDVEMNTCGFIHVPEVSSNFTLNGEVILIAASDGIFDGDIWGNDEEFLKFVFGLSRKGADAQKISASLYNEILRRTKDKTRMDDISMFVHVVPKVRLSLANISAISSRNNKKRLVNQPKAYSTSIPTFEGDASEKLRQLNNVRTMRSRRITIQRVETRGANLFKIFSRRGPPKPQESHDLRKRSLDEQL